MCKIKNSVVFLVILFIIGCNKPKTETSEESTNIVTNTAEETNILIKDEKAQEGQIIYDRVCAACHQPDGQGVPEFFPPLANSDYLNEDAERAIRIVKYGQIGEMKVNGKIYNNQMSAQNLTDAEVASVLTYVYNKWSNKGIKITEKQVKNTNKK